MGDPAAGITVGDLVCDSCGEVVDVRVAPIAITRRWRSWWPALTVLVLLALTVVRSSASRLSGPT